VHKKIVTVLIAGLLVFMIYIVATSLLSGMSMM